MPFVYRASAVFCGVCSLMVLSSEVVAGFWPRLSLIRGVILAGSAHYGGTKYLGIICFSYVATCAYSSLFQFKIFSEYRLFSMRQSDSFSLLFNASMVCRLVPPLGLNFLYLVDIRNSVFEQVVVGESHFGQQFAEVYNWVLPPAVCLLCVLSLLRALCPWLCCFSWVGSLRSKEALLVDDITLEMTLSEEVLVETELITQKGSGVMLEIASPNSDPRLPRRITDTNRSQYGATSLEQRFDRVSESPRGSRSPVLSPMSDEVQSKLEERYARVYGESPDSVCKEMLL